MAEPTQTSTASGMVKLIRERYNGETHVTLEEVRDAAGFSASRSCDVISLGTWPSRGLTLRGFEVKVSRADWKREMEQPQKAEAFAPYCDEWYIAAGSSKIVQADELPETWGLLVSKGSRLDLVKPAVKNPNPEPIDRGFLVALLKRAKEQGPVKAAIEAAERAGYERGKRDGMREQPEHSPDYAQRLLKEKDALEAKILAFERAAGLHMQDLRYGDPQKLGEALRAVMHGAQNPVRLRSASVAARCRKHRIGPPSSQRSAGPRSLRIHSMRRAGVCRMTPDHTHTRVGDMNGQRVEYSGGDLPPNGSFWKDARDGKWYAMTPNGHPAGLANHNIVEHEDGTITASPSIEVLTAWDAPGEQRPRSERSLWHGFLERGVWREC